MSPTIVSARTVCAIVAACSLATAITAVRAEPRLEVSETRRYLVRENGEPFFYLGDTAWELFHRLNREEADDYLRRRAEQGFTVIQAVALAELDGLNSPNPYGHRPLVDNDPTRPDVKEGPRNDYWDHVDYVMDKAESLGLVVGLLPTWGDKWNKKWGVGPEVFTPENADVYGEWLARRYRDKPIIWILGGDRPVETDRHRAIIEAMADGLSRGDEGRHLITFHPVGCHGSSQWFHDAPWLDFNMRQNGHSVNYQQCYAEMREDFDRQPVKPVTDGEPVYEDVPIALKAGDNGHSIAADVRRAMYWDLFSGGFGHAYGHHSVWQMWSEDRQPVLQPLMSWRAALERPGAAQMRHGKHLIESRPQDDRRPDDGLVVAEAVTTAIPGAGRLRLVAMCDGQGRYAMVYSPAGRSFEVSLRDQFNGPRITAWWYNPRTGDASRIAEYSKGATQRFTPPDLGEYLDWILVLDSSEENFPPPGTQSK